jgi:hypothetical protein
VPAHGQLVGVWWWRDQGQDNTVEIYWNGGRVRSFRSAPEAMKFLRTLPIDSYVKPTGEVSGGIPLSEPVEADPKFIFDELEKLMTPKAYSIKHVSLFSHATDAVFTPLFKPS